MQTPPPPARILDRVRALLAKAESSTYPEEIDSLNAKAQELIARFGIDQILLAASGNTVHASGVAFQRIPVARLRPYAMSKVRLIGVVAIPMGCRVLTMSVKRRLDMVEIWGFPADLQRAELIYTSLLLQADGRVADLYPPSGSGEDAGAYRRSWWVGFTVAISDRVQAQERRAARHAEQARARRAPGGDDGPGVALALRSRDSAVMEALSEAWKQKKIPKVSEDVRSVAGGMTAGYRAGHEADIGSARLDAGIG
jgi:hypothetical protein